MHNDNPLPLVDAGGGDVTTPTDEVVHNEPVVTVATDGSDFVFEKPAKRVFQLSRLVNCHRIIKLQWTHFH